MRKRRTEVRLIVRLPAHLQTKCYPTHQIKDRKRSLLEGKASVHAKALELGQDMNLYLE